MKWGPLAPNQAKTMIRTLVELVINNTTTEVVVTHNLCENVWYILSVRLDFRLRFPMAGAEEDHIVSRTGLDIAFILNQDEARDRGYY